MVIKTVIFLYVVSLLCSCYAYKLLLVFPVPSKSHAILGEGYVKHLARAGHEITYITPLPMRDSPAGVRQIDVSENNRDLPVDAIFDTRQLMTRELDLQDMESIMNILTLFANFTLHIDSVQNLLSDPKEQFDAVIVEWMYTELFSGLATVFNCPLIWSSSMEAHSTVLSLIDEQPNPAYTTHHLSRHYGSSFWHRVYQLWMTVNEVFLKWSRYKYESQMFIDIYEKFVIQRGRTLPPYENVQYNGSLMLGNSYISTGEAISLPDSYKSVGGYHIDKEQDPLPKDIQKIMDNSEHGVIYFSMGTILKSSRIPERTKTEILKVFGALNHTVIWKFEEVLADVPKNVHILAWAPQTSILAHSKCVLFITHGGLLSKLEALHFGVPMIGIPQYADQFLNINRAESRGFGKRVDLTYGALELELAIREILGNSSYRERAKEYSFIQHHRPSPPEKELVHWIEHVIETRGALHLRSRALRVPWYQKTYLDLAVVILLIFLIIVRLCKYGRAVGTRYMKKKML